MSAKTCPERKTLSDFLLGKLDPQTSSECENHLAQCKPCVETISGLDISDTFQSLVVDSAAESDVASVGDESVVGNLIHRMIDIGKETRSDRGSLDQRAADVVSVLEPATTNDSIGQIEHYRIEEVLGCGSTGVVFRAIDENLHRPVAIKVLRPTLGDAARERFIAEARATAILDHPNIVTIFQVGDSGSLAFIVMQWLPGETLEHRLARESALSPETVRGFGQQIANGLAAAHEKGLVHRDIKPANLWITKNEEVKILDFGLVRIMDESPQLTCTGMIAGTPCYMSPEQSRGDELDSRSDLFSLGCVLYQCLTGKLPFESSNALATLQAIQREQPASPSILDAATPVDVSDLVMSLLEKSPHRRPSSAIDVSKAFGAERDAWPFECESYCDSKPQRSIKIQLKEPRLTSSSRWRWIALALLTGIIGWGAFMFGPQIIRIATDQGQIVIESNDPDVQIEVLSGGETIEVVDLKTKQSIQIKSGNYQIRAVGDENSISIDKATLTLSRGESAIVTVTKNDKLTKEVASRKFPQAVSTASESAEMELAVDGLPGQILPSAKRVSTTSAPIDPNHKVRAGDVLSVFIENAFGGSSFGQEQATSQLHLGLPVHVRSDGTISLPYVDPVNVAGKSALEIENELKKLFVGPVVKEGFVSVVVQSTYGVSTKTLTEPVYDGMTYAQCLNAIKYERDGEKLSKPILGIMELKDSDEIPELIDPLTEAVVRVVKLNLADWRVTNHFINWLNDEQLQSLVVSMSASDSNTNWKILREYALSNWVRLGSTKNDVFQNTVKAMQRGRIPNERPASILIELLKNELLDTEQRETCRVPLLESFKTSKNAQHFFNELSQIDGELKGLGDAIAEAIPRTESGNCANWIGSLSRMSEENLNAAIVPFATRAFRDGYCQFCTEYLSKIPATQFKLIEPEFEKQLKNSNAMAHTIKMERDQREFENSKSK